MPIPPEVQAVVTRLRTITDEMAKDAIAAQARYDLLLGRLANATTLEEAKAVGVELSTELDKLDATAAWLDAAGKTVDNPVPPAPPTDPVDPNAPQSFRVRR